MVSVISRGFNIRLFAKPPAERLDADILIQKMKDLPRLPPAEIQDRKEICQARTFLKHTKSERKRELEIELLAARLGITSDQLKDPDFVAFAEHRKLYNYLATYNHTLGFSEGEILLNPSQSRWSEIKETALQTLPNEGEPVVYPWVYDNNGIRKIRDMSDWKTPEAFVVKDPAAWGGGYAIQLCTTTVSHARQRGDHTFFRLCSATGEVYSFGIYDPNKGGPAPGFSLSSWEAFSKWVESFMPFRAKKGIIMSPDVSEFWGVSIQVATFAVTKEQFDAQMKLVTEDKEKGTRFQLLSDNCTSWSLKFARLAGIDIPCKAMASRSVTHWKFVDFIDKHYHKLPSLIQKIGRFAMVIFFNLVSLVGGSYYADREVREDLPHLNSPFDMFRDSKLMVDSPHQLGQRVIPRINRWQAEQGSFAVPPVSVMTA